MKLNIPAQAIAFAAHFMADNDIRYYLKGIYVRPMTPDEGGGVLAAATNGYILGMWRCDADKTVCERAAILRITPGLVSACRKNTEQRRVTIANNRITVIESGKAVTDVTATEVYIQPATGWVAGVCEYQPWELPGSHIAKYPDIMRPVPDATENGAVGKMRADYIETIAKAFRESMGRIRRRKGYVAGINMRQVDANTSTLVVSEDIPQAVAIIMPMRAGVQPVPTWLARAKAINTRDFRAKASPLPVHEPSDAGPREDDGRGWDVVRSQA